MIRQAFVSLAALPALIGVAGSTSVPGGAGPSEFAQQLDRLPAAMLTAESGAMVQYLDMTEVWKRLGVAADPVERLDNLGATGQFETFSQPSALFDAYAADVDGARGEIGFSFVELDREASILAPPNRIIVAETSVNPEAVTTAVQTDPLWSDLLTVQHGADGDFWQWGDDPMATELTRRSTLRPLGQGGVLALLDGQPTTVIRALDPADLESAQRTMTGTEPSVLDAGPIADAAALVGDSTVIQALGTADPVLIVEVIDGDASATQILWPMGTPEAAAEFAATAEEFLAGDDPVTGQPTSELLPDATVDTVGSVVRLTSPAPGTYRTAVTMLMNRVLPLAVG